MGGIYEGKRVLEISDEKGMYCGKLLTMVGMEVIKIEPEEGDPQRLWGPFAGHIEDKERGLFWIYYNTGKKSVTLDIYSDEGKEIVKKLASEADVLIETLDPGEMAKLGLGYEDIKAVNPMIVYCSITTFGQDGPYVNWNASSEIIPYALAGNMNENGRPGFNYAPLSMGRNFTYNASGLYSAVAILAYVRRAVATGEGAYLDTAAIEVAALWRNEDIANPQRFPYTPERKKLGSATPFPPGGMFKCKDGSVFIVGMSQWKSLSEWMKESGMDIGEFDDEKYKIAHNTNPDVCAHADELNALVAELCEKYTKDELYKGGLKWHVPVVPMFSPEDVYTDEHYNERGFFVRVNHPVAGECNYPGAPARLTETPLKVDQAAPLLGSSNEEILGNM